MKIEQKKYSPAKGWETLSKEDFNPQSCNLVLVYGSTRLLLDAGFYSTIRESYPNANILMNSTAGEIIGIEVNDETLSLTAITFEKTKIKSAAIDISEMKDSYDAGKNIAFAFEPAGLKSVLVISDGLKVNGSELVLGLRENLPAGTIITGGLAADGTRFTTPMVGLNETPVEGRIAAIAFYGDSLTVTYGSIGGWDPFGPERLITKSKGNILYELDGQCALDIYKTYLGDLANELPGSGLFFPLSIRNPGSDHFLVRTILSINDQEKSVIFAGDMPEGAYATLMKGNFDRLIEGASHAAQNSILEQPRKPDLAILISCSGRKLVLNQRVEEEVEAVRNIYGTGTAITGFYSYGEISPAFNSTQCELHNQTMTVTTFTEQ